MGVSEDQGFAEIGEKPLIDTHVNLRSQHAQFIISGTMTAVAWRLFYPVYWGPRIDFAATTFHCLGFLVVGSLLFFLAERKFQPPRTTKSNIKALADLVKQDEHIPPKKSTIYLSPWVFPILLFLWVVLQAGSTYVQQTETQLVRADPRSGLYVWSTGRDKCKPSIVRQFSNNKTIRYKSRWEAERNGFRPAFGCPAGLTK